MLGNLHVRFGGGNSETCYSNIIRRWVSTLPDIPESKNNRIENCTGLPELSLK